MKSIGLSLLVLPLMMSALFAAEPVRLTNDGRLKRDPVFLKPNGSELIYVVLDKPNQLRLMKFTLSNRVSVPVHPEETRSEFEPTVSRDGRYLAFVQNRGNLSLALVIQDLVENKQSEQPPAGGFSGMHSPTIAPDDTRVLYSFPEDGRQHLFECSITAENRRRIVDSEGINNWPDFSPDGRRIVFGSSREDDFEIYVMHADGTGVTRLTHSPKQDIRPKFSPDGRRIAFTSNRDGNYEIYVMNADGSGQRRVTQRLEHDDCVCWHPDGKSLIVVSEQAGRCDLFQLSEGLAE